MSHEHKLAVQRIISICEKTQFPNDRIFRILDIALEAEGLTENQRQMEIARLKEDAATRRDAVFRPNTFPQPALQSRSFGGLNG